MIIDTNIFIDIFRGKSETLNYIENLNENIATTIVNKYELLRGNNKIKNMFEGITVYNFGNNEVMEAAELYQYLKHKGILVNELDIIIAAIAKANNQQILTKDKDFENFQEIIEIRFL
jgi:predicted nucleic acid-binding protein